MSDISVANIDTDQKSPRLARAELLASIQRINRGFRIIVLPETDVLENVVLIDSSGRIGIGGAADATQLLKLYGSLTLSANTQGIYANNLTVVNASAAMVVSSLAARMSLRTGSSPIERLGIDGTSGSVQIGGSSAATNPLAVYGNHATDAAAMVRQDGAGNIMNWVGASAVVMASLTAAGALTTRGTKAVNASTASTYVNMTADSTVGNLPTLLINNNAAAANNRLFAAQVATDGTFNMRFASDDLASLTTFMSVTRNANLATNITLTGTALTLSARTDFDKNYTEKSVAVTATATTVIDCSLGNVFAVAMNASITTLTLNNVPASGKVYNLTLKLKQDATGNRSVTWPAAVRWAGATAPTLTAGANKIDFITLVTDDAGATWQGFVGGLNYA